MSENAVLIDQLKATAAAVLDALIAPRAPVILLGYPSTSNVGDTLIWLGEMAYLRHRQVRLHYVCDHRNCDPAEVGRIIDRTKASILIHGGGNFGTLWPEIQGFREELLERFRGVPTIQLPQSLHFEDANRLAKMQRIIRAHGQFTLLVRDKSSYGVAQQNFDCGVELCPDMAFFIGPLASRRRPACDRMILSRTDLEKRDDWRRQMTSSSGEISASTADWLDSGTSEKILQRIERHSANLRSPLDKDHSLLLRLWNLLAQARLARGLKVLQRGRVVITDRLHAHILCTRLSKPHVLIDNSYGKLSSFYHAWTDGLSLARLAGNAEGAAAMAAELDRLLLNSN